MKRLRFVIIILTVMLFRSTAFSQDSRTTVTKLCPYALNASRQQIIDYYAIYLNTPVDRETQTKDSTIIITFVHNDVFPFYASHYVIKNNKCTYQFDEFESKYINDVIAFINSFDDVTKIDIFTYNYLYEGNVVEMKLDSDKNNSYYLIQYIIR